VVEVTNGARVDATAQGGGFKPRSRREWHNPSSGEAGGWARLEEERTLAKFGTSDGRLAEFRRYRERMNERILASDHLGIKRFFTLDGAAYRDGALPETTKELLGLVASTVLRCDDCIDYHLIRCVEVGWSDEELLDALNIALVVGGSIVIPHLRHAVETIDLLRAEAGGPPAETPVASSGQG
jgi:AhpD family alkylhydroperoxidase